MKIEAFRSTNARQDVYGYNRCIKMGKKPVQDVNASN